MSETLETRNLKKKKKKKSAFCFKYLRSGVREREAVVAILFLITKQEKKKKKRKRFRGELNFSFLVFISELGEAAARDVKRFLHSLIPLSSLLCYFSLALSEKLQLFLSPPFPSFSKVNHFILFFSISMDFKSLLLQIFVCLFFFFLLLFWCLVTGGAEVIWIVNLLCCSE